jgi:signal transduction histidine kinase
MSTPTVEELRRFDLLEGLDDEHLAEVAARAEIHAYRAGEVIAQDGEESRGVYLLLEGTAETYTAVADVYEPAGEHVAPTWLGAIAALTGAPLGVRVQASTDLRLAEIAPEDFVDLALANRSIMSLVLARVRPVVGRITSIEQNRERLESLGTMAAGLAHELNNPAAAARRASSDLADALDVLSSTIGVFVESGIERSEAAELVKLQAEALKRAGERSPLSALDASDAEEAVAATLEAAGVEDGWRLAEPLSRAGVDQAFLNRICELAGPASGAALRWIAASLLARDLADELAESTERMSRLVGAVKRYAYMDRGGLVESDIHEDIETTLTILGHKLKHTSIEIRREYDPELPRIGAFGAELNQVWTNLLDNAIDAVGEKGTITILTRRDGECVEVDLADDGPGIPEEIRERIFDPFFTTKEVGRGTGLGLDTARRIVVERHRGSLTIESGPGGTVFRVRLPIEQAVAPA